MKNFTPIHVLIKAIIAYSMLFLTTTIFGQGVSESKSVHIEKQYLFSPELMYQSDTFIGLNIGIGHIGDDPEAYIPAVGFTGLRMGIEANLDPENFTLAPKIGLEASFIFLSTRLSAVHYFQEKRKELRVVPELGISLGGWAQLNYGYGITLFNGNIQNVSLHRINLSFNLSRDLQNAAFQLFGI